MTKLRDLYRCEICGNVVEILHEGAPALVCCNEPMQKLEPKTEDATNEKHVPYVESKGEGVLVKIGKEVDHPMIEKHYIKFIEVMTKDKVYRKELKPGMKPQAEFPVKKEDIIKTREFCNVHMFWKS